MSKLFVKTVCMYDKSVVKTLVYVLIAPADSYLRQTSSRWWANGVTLVVEDTQRPVLLSLDFSRHFLLPFPSFPPLPPLFDRGTHYVAMPGLKFTELLLPLLPECWALQVCTATPGVPFLFLAELCIFHCSGCNRW